MKEKAKLLLKTARVLLIIFVISLMSSSAGKETLILTSYNKNLANMMNEDITIAYVEEDEEKGNYIALETFKGVLTAYGYDCAGCIGITASGYDIREGNIYYDDETYGQLRIIAADKKYPFGTVMRITEGEKQVIAIVLDRGGAIYTGNVDADLVVSSEKVAVKEVGKWSNATFEVLRYGYKG